MEMKDVSNYEIQDLGIINGKVYMDGIFTSNNVYIKDGKISSITSQNLPCKEEVDAKGDMVLPGLIDPHVHFKLGVGERVSSDDFHAGSVKAALGGITTYIDFLDPVKEADEIAGAFEKRLALAKDSVTDYAFHATIANPKDSAMKMIQASKEVGITSIKLFTTYSDTDRRTKDHYIYELLSCSKTEDIKVVIHAENDELVWNRKDILVKDHEKSRPVISENVEIMKLASMAKETGGNLYIVHVSAGSSVKQLAKHFSKELKNQKIILESCPHYFIFDSSVYEREDGYQYTMTPPLRPEQEKEMLKEYIDYISTIGTDHCPCDESLKKQTFTSQIFMGIGGIQYSFLNMYTLFQDAIIDKFTKEPAKAYGLFPKKGCIIPGADADILIFDPNAYTTVQDKESVYDGMALKGAVKSVYVRGQLVVDEGKVHSMTGKYIRRQADVRNQ
jgi:dihydropyrimidinase